MNNFEENQKNYAKMSKPFASMEDAEKAVKNFHDGVKKLRQKHRIAEVVAISEVYVEIDGELKEFSSLTTCGDLMRAIYMVSRQQLKISLDTIQQVVEIIREK